MTKDMPTHDEIEERIEKNRNTIKELEAKIYRDRLLLLSPWERDARERKRVQYEEDISGFIEKDCITGGSLWAPLIELYQEYLYYDFPPKHRPLTKRLFSKALKKKGFEFKKGRQPGFSGLYFIGIDTKSDPKTN